MYVCMYVCCFQVIKQGEVGSSFFVIVSGEVNVTIDGKSGRPGWGPGRGGQGFLRGRLGFMVQRGGRHGRCSDGFNS